MGLEGALACRVVFLLGDDLQELHARLSLILQESIVHVVLPYLHIVLLILVSLLGVAAGSAAMLSLPYPLESLPLDLLVGGG